MKKHYLVYTPDEMIIAAKVYERFLPTLEVAYYLMNRDMEQEFLLFLISAENVDMKNLLAEERRSTDLIVPIDESKNFYGLICQETKVKGGYALGERLIRNIVMDKGSETYCTQLDVRKLDHQVKDVLFELIDIFTKSKRDKKVGEMVFGSLH